MLCSIRLDGFGSMRCIQCGSQKDKVVDSREVGAGDAIRRRRECLSCGRRFTSYERIEEVPYLVVKKDGRREAFDRGKLLAGLHRACEKRPVSAKALTEVSAGQRRTPLLPEGWPGQ